MSRGRPQRCAVAMPRGYPVCGTCPVYPNQCSSSCDCSDPSIPTTMRSSAGVVRSMFLPPRAPGLCTVPPAHEGPSARPGRAADTCGSSGRGPAVLATRPRTDHRDRPRSADTGTIDRGLGGALGFSAGRAVGAPQYPTRAVVGPEAGRKQFAEQPDHDQRRSARTGLVAPAGPGTRAQATVGRTTSSVQGAADERLAGRTQQQCRRSHRAPGCRPPAAERRRRASAGPVPPGDGCQSAGPRRPGTSPANRPSAPRASGSQPDSAWCELLPTGATRVEVLTALQTQYRRSAVGRVGSNPRPDGL